MSDIGLYIKNKTTPLITERIEPKAENVRRVYSELLQDSYTIEPSGEIMFSDKTRYSARELALIKTLDNKAKLAIHRAKRILGGELIK